MKIQGETALCAFVQFEDVTKIYKTGDVEVKALSGASFEIQKGEFCVIVGESGAGKTTLLNILGGMDTLTTGRVRMDGVEISSFDRTKLENYRRFDIGFVFQFYNLIPNLTALENVEIAAQLCPDPVPADEMLRAVGLGHRMNNFPAQLSGGEQQRVSIARVRRADRRARLRNRQIHLKALAGYLPARRHDRRHHHAQRRALRHGGPDRPRQKRHDPFHAHERTHHARRGNRMVTARCV